MAFRDRFAVRLGKGASPVRESDLRAYFRRGGALSFDSSPSGPMLARLDAASATSDGERLESRTSKDRRGFNHRDGESRARHELAKMGIELAPDWEEQVESQDPTITADYQLETRNVAIQPHDLHMVQNADVERALWMSGREHATTLYLYYGPPGDDCMRSVPWGRLTILMPRTTGGGAALVARAAGHQADGTVDTLTDPVARMADEYSANRIWPDISRSLNLSAAEDEARIALASANAAVGMGT